MAILLDPVPGRECGECNYCCQHLTIDTPELQSPAGILCTNWARGIGCTIYGTRPQVCRSYMCGWRMLEHFDDSWRPDRCGVMMSVIDTDIPDTYQKQGIDLMMIDAKLAITRPAFIQFLVSAIEARIPLFLSLRGPAGHAPASVFLNTYLEDTVQKRDETNFLTVFNAILNKLANSEFKPVPLKHA